MISAKVRYSIENLIADYAHYIDDDRLEEWLDFFSEDCVYKILSRENVEQALPLELLSCRNKNMLRDRILSLREANIYNIHLQNLSHLTFCQLQLHSHLVFVAAIFSTAFPHSLWHAPNLF